MKTKDLLLTCLPLNESSTCDFLIDRVSAVLVFTLKIFFNILFQKSVLIAHVPIRSEGDVIVDWLTGNLLNHKGKTIKNRSVEKCKKLKGSFKKSMV